MNIRSGLVSLPLVFLASSVLLEARASDEWPPLIRPADSTIPPQDPEDSSVLRQRAVVVDIRLARDPRTTRLRLPLFDNTALKLKRKKRTTSLDDAVVWIGRVEGQEASAVILAVGTDVLIGKVSTQGTIRQPADYYEIGYLGNGVHVLRQYDPSTLPPDSNPIAPKYEQTKTDELRSADVPMIAATYWRPDDSDFPQGGHGDRESAPRAAAVASKAVYRRGPPPDDPTCTNDSRSTIDVLVVYTTATKDKAAAKDKTVGAQAIETAIESYIGEANDSYDRSGVGLQLQLVHTELVENYEESGDPVTDLDNLSQPIVELKEVHDSRNTYGADIVGLILEYNKKETDKKGCGQAHLMEDPSKDFERFAFAAIPRRCADRTMGLAHEFGHLMGARHDWEVDRGEDNPEKPYSYSHGYVHVVQPPPPFRTIMSKNDRCNKHRCDLLPYWSNPDIHHPVSGWPMGCPASGVPTACEDEKEPSNNAKTLDKTAPIVANFRCSKN